MALSFSGVGLLPTANPALASLARPAGASLTSAPTRLVVSAVEAPVGASVEPAILAPGIPAFAHIYVIVMENREYESIVGNTAAPYLNALIRRYGLATNYHAVAHPSEPNYFALFAGSTFDKLDDGVHTLAAYSLVDQLERHHRTWHVYAQDYPGRCSLVSSAYGGVDLVGAPGYYARKHEPAISFLTIARDPTRCKRITRLSGFNPAAANFELIVPNMTNDMHDGSTSNGDAFLRAFVPKITRSAAFANSLLVITWDEGSSSRGVGGRVPTILISPKVRVAARSSASYTHYSLLRTIENAWGIGCLHLTCGSNDLSTFFVRH